MIKVIALIICGIFLMSAGIYFLSVAKFPAFVFPFFDIRLPNVDWGLVGFVIVAGGIASFGSAALAVKIVR